MGITTEIFVLAVFVVALPIYLLMLKSAKLPGEIFFLSAYLFFLLSNILTVIEGWILPDIMNIFEHLAITTGSLCFMLGIKALVESRINGVPNARNNQTK